MLLIARKFLATKLSYTFEKNNGALANKPLSGLADFFKEHNKLLLKLSKYSCELNIAF